MEERIIDDEYGRGIRLKKTKEGYVDVTDELAEEGEEGYEETEEVAFEFPVLDTDEDDEDLVGLSPEEAARVRREKEEALKKRRADYEQACQEGDELLASGSFHAAELKFENALQLDDDATEASVGYWRAKTADFTDPDVLIDEYTEAGFESLEYDLGIDATATVCKKYKSAFEKRLQELSDEEKPLAEEVESKQAARRTVLSERVKRATVGFVSSLLPAVALLVLTVIFGMKNFTTRENTFVLPTILLGVAFFISLIVFIVLANKYINALRIRSANERLSSTEGGTRLLQIRARKELYQTLIYEAVVEVEEGQE